MDKPTEKNRWFGYYWKTFGNLCVGFVLVLSYQTPLLHHLIRVPVITLLLLKHLICSLSSQVKEDCQIILLVTLLVALGI